MFVAGHYFSEGSVHVIVPQMSVLGPFLFSIDINDLPLCISSADVEYDMFADDSSPTAAGQSIDTIQNQETTTPKTNKKNTCSHVFRKYLISVLPR